MIRKRGNIYSFRQKKGRMRIQMMAKYTKITGEHLSFKIVEYLGLEGFMKHKFIFVGTEKCQNI